MSGETMMTDLPMRLTCTAAITAAVDDDIRLILIALRRVRRPRHAAKQNTEKTKSGHPDC